MIVLKLFLSILLFSGFNFLGKKVTNKLNINFYLSKIVNLYLINTVAGIIFTLLCLYPLLLYEIINLLYLKILVIIFMLTGALNIFYSYDINFSKKYLKFYKN